MLDERPSVRLALRRRFRYIVVDEAQDANPQQLSTAVLRILQNPQIGVQQTEPFRGLHQSLRRGAAARVADIVLEACEQAVRKRN